MTPCHLAHIGKSFGELLVSIFDPEDGGGGYFRNAGVRGSVSRKRVIATWLLRLTRNWHLEKPSLSRTFGGFIANVIKSS